MLSLAAYYSVYQSQMIGTFDPKGDLIAYKAMVEKQPNLKCDCQRQSIPFREFATPTVDINAACAWVKTDLEAEISSCRALDLSGYCASVRDACEQSDSFISWIMDEFNNSVVSSPVLIHDRALEYSTTASFDSNFKIGELVAAAPKVSVRAWAAANMPRIMRVIGDVTTRVKAQAKKVNYLYDNTDDGFARACASSTPIICRGSSDFDDDYALQNGGAVPVNCTRADTTPSCDITKVADGTCDPECMSPECLFDGGDCANNQIAKSFPRDLRQTFTLLDARLSPDTDDPDSSWLDSTPDAFIDSTRRRCDDAESWTKTETILEDVNMYGSSFGGYDFSLLAEVLIDVSKSNSKYPRAANGDKVEFRASVSLGCDQYEKELKENLFMFYTPTEFRYFLNEMRKLTGSDIFDSEETVPYEWTCDHSYYGTGDGCDCVCGAWDPDCEDASLQTYNCPNPSDVCAKAGGGTCQASSSAGYYDFGSDYGDYAASNVPFGWTCEASYYGAGDGCDCECGAWDSDCDDASSSVYGCSGDTDVCVNTNGGTCQASASYDSGSGSGSTTPASVPTEWTCSDSFYGATDGCDCACGAWDPDCDDASSSVYGCSSDTDVCVNTNGGTCQASSSSGSGSGSMSQYPPPPPPPDSSSAPTEWTCDLAYYGANDGCDCACGAWDPDCDGAYGASLYGCSDDDDVCVNTNGGTCQGSKRRRLQASEDYDGEDLFRNYLDPNKELYTKSGFAFLENFAAPLMGKHMNLETAIDNLFVDKRDLEVDYEKYFTACKVSSCTFTYMSASSLAGVAAVIIGLLGGINNAMNATFKVVYAVMRTTIVKKTKIKMTEGNAMETPATYEGAQPSITPQQIGVIEGEAIKAPATDENARPNESPV